MASYLSNEDDQYHNLKKFDIKSIRQDTRHVQAGIRSLNAGISRVSSIPDPVLKYSMTLETLHTGFTVGVEAWLCYMENECEDYNTKLEQLNKLLKETDDGDKFCEQIKSKMFSLEQSINLCNQNIRGIKEFSKTMDQHLDGISKWIQTPIYGPDHPYGEKLVENAKNSHDELEKSLLSKGKILDCHQ